VTTARWVSRIIGAMMILGVLVIAAMATWSVLRPEDPGPALPVAAGPALGDLTGYVGQVDGAARTLAVTDNVLGLRPITLMVTDDTSITVHGKQGALGDLSRDTPVRVFYEVRDGVKYVTSVQVITGLQASGPTAPAAGTMVEAAPVAVSAPASQAPAQPKARVAAIVTPAPPVSAPPSPSGTAVVPSPVSAAAPPGEAASIGATRAAVASPEDAGDGSAVIDWLFESRRR
jgi:hypothetical protein